MKAWILKQKYRVCWSKNKYAFTLVELIIVVVILAILATIAFLTLWNYRWETINVKRLSDKNNIEKALEIYKINKMKLIYF